MKCPLSGKLCLKPKDIQVTEIESGEAKVYHLCKECGGDYLTMPQANDVLSSLGQITSTPNGIEQEFTTKSHTPPPRRCPKCDSTLEDILRNQKVGCSECFQMHPELESLVMRCQGALPGEQIEHVGKVPPVSPDSRLQEQLERLEKKMAAAVKIENYEQAATIRDAIKELKSRIK